MVNPSTVISSSSLTTLLEIPKRYLHSSSWFKQKCKKNVEFSQESGSATRKLNPKIKVFHCYSQDFLYHFNIKLSEQRFSSSRVPGKKQKLEQKNDFFQLKCHSRPTKKSKTAKVDLKGEISIALRATSGRLYFLTWSQSFVQPNGNFKFSTFSDKNFCRMADAKSNIRRFLLSDIRQFLM